MRQRSAWLPTAPKKRRSEHGTRSLRRLIIAPTPMRFLFRQTPDGHKTRPGSHDGEPPVRRDSRTSGSQKRKDQPRTAERWSEETIVQSGAQRTLEETKSGWQIAKQVSVLFLLKLKSVISVIIALSIHVHACTWQDLGCSYDPRTQLCEPPFSRYRKDD